MDDGIPGVEVEHLLLATFVGPEFSVDIRMFRGLEKNHIVQHILHLSVGCFRWLRWVCHNVATRTHPVHTDVLVE